MPLLGIPEGVGRHFRKKSRISFYVVFFVVLYLELFADFSLASPGGPSYPQVLWGHSFLDGRLFAPSAGGVAGSAPPLGGALAPFPSSAPHVPSQ